MESLTAGSYPSTFLKNGLIFCMKFLPIRPQPTTPSVESCEDAISAIWIAGFHSPARVVKVA